jgi:putative transposase
VLLRIDGEVARFSVGMCIDVATRRRKTIVSHAPRGHATAALMGRCVADWGMPHVVRPDNGKEFINERIVRLCGALGVVLDPPPPGTPEGKPFVERAFNTLNQHMEVLPSFVGHNTGQRAQIRELKGENTLIDLAMDVADFQAWLDDWCDEQHATLHSEMKRTPNQQLEHFIKAGWEPKPMPFDVVTMEQLSARSWGRTAGRSHISVEGRKYITERLGELAGKDVVVYEVPDDICRIRVYSPDLKEFYGEAQWEIHLTAEEQAEMAAKAKAIQAGMNERFGLAKRRSKKLERDFAKRPDKLLRPTAEAAALQQVSEVFRPEVLPLREEPSPLVC